MLDPISGFSNTTIQIAGRRFLNFSGCDYLGFSSDRDVTNAARRAITQFGVSARASRIVTGTLTIHLDLERDIAAFLNVADTVTVPSGWMASTLAALALARTTCDKIFININAHPALRAAARAAMRPIVIVKSIDPTDWKRAIEKSKSKAPLILSDSIALPDCTFYPLRELLKIVEFSNGYIIIDDAHGIGIVGKRGRGVAELLELSGSRFVITGSLSKAFGAQGGFIAGSENICNEARNMHLYVGATPLSPPIAAAAACAVRLSGEPRGRELRHQLKSNVRFVTNELTKRNITFFSNPDIPWLSFFAAGEHPAALSDHLYQKGILAPNVQYAGGPAGGYVRASVNARHTKKHLQQFVAAFAYVLVAALVLYSCAGGPRRTIITDVAAAKAALVDVRTIDPSIIVELRYNQSDNFVKRNVYHSDLAYLRRDAARRLARANVTLNDLGFKLKIWDAYRPYSVQVEMWDIVRDDRYVANPAKGSRHNRGAAVDVTLTDINNREVEMPTLHDDFSERASPASRSTPAAERHAAILANCMIAAGFSPLDTEWWHFDAPGWQDYDLLDVPLTDLARGAGSRENK